MVGTGINDQLNRRSHTAPARNPACAIFGWRPIDATRKIDRVDLGVSASNSAAIDCYEELGLARVGTWPDAIMIDKQMIDVVWMTMTREVWLCSREKG
jgi:RimJ/RimL family protein N-acetyltransferase